MASDAERDLDRTLPAFRDTDTGPPGELPPRTPEEDYAAICAQVNAELRVEQVIEYLGWYPERLVKSEDVYLALCPLHREEVFRTLVLNPAGNTYQCRHVKCPGHSPSDLIDLIARHFEESMPEALARLVDEFGADAFGLTEGQIGVLEKVLQSVREGESPGDEEQAP